MTSAELVAAVEAGINLVLSEDVTNPEPDHRSPRDWRCAPVIPKGTRFFAVRETLDMRGIRLYRTGDYGHNAVMFMPDGTVHPIMAPLARALLPALSAGVRTLAEIEKSGATYTGPAATITGSRVLVTGFREIRSDRRAALVRLADDREVWVKTSRLDVEVADAPHADEATDAATPDEAIARSFKTWTPTADAPCPEAGSAKAEGASVIRDERLDVALARQSAGLDPIAPFIPPPSPWADEALSLGELLAAIDVTIERDAAGDHGATAAALPIIREVVEAMRANAVAHAEGK
jgi:hypothetical protein